MDNSKSLINYIEENPNLTHKQLKNAVVALGGFKEKNVVSFLLKLLDNEEYDWQIKNAIAISLGDIGFEEAVPAWMLY